MPESYSEVAETLKAMFGPRESRWICHECGKKKGRVPEHNSTWHIGYCEVCNETKPVTESRDYGVWFAPEKESEGE